MGVFLLMINKIFNYFQVFLQHLSALSPRSSFGALWLRVVALQRALISAPAEDPLTEAALESLKNMILVMDSVRVSDPVFC